MPDRPTLRLDKWLWHARFFKTRTLAAKQVTSGHVRVNSVKTAKAATPVGPEDVLTFPQARRIRVIRITGIGARRGPPAEAQALYEDLTPPEVPKPPAPEARIGNARPTKRDRREIDRLKGS